MTDLMNINCIKDKTQKYNKMEDLFNKLYMLISSLLFLVIF